MNSTPGTGKGPPIMLIILILIVCLCALIGGGYYWYTTTQTTDTKDTSSASDAPASTSAQTASDPRSSIWSLPGSVLLQDVPLEIGTVTSAIPVKNQPTPLNNPATFTISFDINIGSTVKNWRSILQNSPVNPGTSCAMGILKDCRRPGVTLGSGPNSDKTNVLTFEFWPTDITQVGTYTGPQTNNPSNKWFNFVITVDSTGLKTYINGVLDSYNNSSKTFNWNSTNNFVWSAAAGNPNLVNTGGSIQVANAYFWPQALTTSQISQLAIPTTADPSVSSTSYYVSEPFRIFQ